MIRLLAVVIGLAQAVLGLRVALRLIRSAGGHTIPRHPDSLCPDARVTVLVPVLNEAGRLGPCLDGLIGQGPEVREILVIDGGSTDGTQHLARRAMKRDGRLRLVDASPVPDNVNGKAYGLMAGLAHASPTSEWIVTIDADVRPDPLLVRSMIAHAVAQRVEALSAATRQRLSGVAEGVLHPAMLATLVYRFGIPGHATDLPDQIQANGQCFLVRRDVLKAAGGFGAVLDSVCEDVTLGRSLAANGTAVGFYETDNLVSVQMYAGAADAWRNWSRSLPMRDRFSGWALDIGLAEVTLVQAAPLWLAVPCAALLGQCHPVSMLNIGLTFMRLGVLVGMARAYEARPVTYWLSPLADLPVAARLWQMSRRRRHAWRGREFGTGDATQ